MRHVCAIVFRRATHSRTHLLCRTDRRWEVLVALLPASDGVGEEVVAGFATVYRFFAFPAGARLRLSQIVVPPPLQRRGVAAALLAAMRALAVAKDAVDYTVEDPTDDLQRLRVRTYCCSLVAGPVCLMHHPVSLCHANARNR